MAKLKLDYTRNVQTRGGSPVRIYEIFYEKYINAAYYDEYSDIWFPVQYDFQGMYASKPSQLDLVNT